MALHGNKKFLDAIDVYKKAATLEPGNAAHSKASGELTNLCMNGALVSHERL